MCVMSRGHKTGWFFCYMSMKSDGTVRGIINHTGWVLKVGNYRKWTVLYQKSFYNAQKLSPNVDLMLLITDYVFVL